MDGLSFRNAAIIEDSQDLMMEFLEGIAVAMAGVLLSLFTSPSSHYTYYSSYFTGIIKIVTKTSSFLLPTASVPSTWKDTT